MCTVSHKRILALNVNKVGFASCLRMRNSHDVKDLHLGLVVFNLKPNMHYIVGVKRRLDIVFGGQEIISKLEHKLNC